MAKRQAALLTDLRRTELDLHNSRSPSCAYFQDGFFRRWSTYARLHICLQLTRETFCKDLLLLLLSRNNKGRHGLSLVSGCNNSATNISSPFFEVTLFRHAFGREDGGTNSNWVAPEPNKWQKGIKDSCSEVLKAEYQNKQWVLE